MRENQQIIPIEVGNLIPKVQEMFDAGYRLVQIGCTKLENNELTYAFDKDYQFSYLKLIAAPDAPLLPSISSIYWCAFLYENEIHDLFGVQFSNMAVDFHGKFYRTAKDKAFSYCERATAVSKPAGDQTSSSSTGSST